MLLFTYGTLRRGQSRHHHLAGQTYLGPARTLPLYVVIPGPDYPCLRVPRAGETPGVVEGELYRIDPLILPQLDEVEGSPWLFKREPIALAEVNEPVYAYFFQQ